jgi:lipoyl synthase
MGDEPSTGGRHPRLPDWLRVKTGKAGLSRATRELVAGQGLHTVCESAHCPNVGECYSCSTATFLIMGPSCTRSCGFCAVDHGPTAPLDLDEPRRLAEAARELGLRYVVITSVTRDDLPDGGATHFAACIRAVRETIPGAMVEVLTPDFRGEAGALGVVLGAEPDVYNHNLETVRRLQPGVRPQAAYDTSLAQLRRAAAHGALTKSGLMLGLGETPAEIEEAMGDLADAGVRLLTLGQYLQPTRRHLPVVDYVPPAQFDAYAALGEARGITRVFAGPFVRSSYRAAEAAAELLSGTAARLAHTDHGPAGAT